MLTEQERDHLVEQYRREPLSVIGLLLTCAGGLVVVIMLALIGMDIHSVAPADAPGVTAQRAP